MIESLFQLLSTSTQHKCFYHFTDSRNVPSIKEEGHILSMRSLKERGINCPAPGGNEWSIKADALVDMDAYVHLCFMNNHPMEYQARNDGRIQHTAWLRVRPEIIRSEGVMATLDVSNKSGIQPIPIMDAIGRMDLEVIYNRTDWKDPAVQSRRNVAKKYEILIPAKISLNYIDNIHG